MQSDNVLTNQLKSNTVLLKKATQKLKELNKDLAYANMLVANKAAVKKEKTKEGEREYTEVCADNRLIVREYTKLKDAYELLTIRYMNTWTTANPNYTPSTYNKEKAEVDSMFKDEKNIPSRWW